MHLFNLINKHLCGMQDYMGKMQIIRGILNQVIQKPEHTRLKKQDLCCWKRKMCCLLESSLQNYYLLHIYYYVFNELQGDSKFNRKLHFPNKYIFAQFFGRQSFGHDNMLEPQCNTKHIFIVIFPFIKCGRFCNIPILRWKICKYGNKNLQPVKKV